jgi:copper/silver efflux system protein
MPVDVFPDLTAPTVTVLTEAHGMAPEEVETLVTFPIETSVNGATGVRRVRSSTSQGISIVWVEFDWGTEIFRRVRSSTSGSSSSALQLPAGAGPPVLAPISSIMGEIMLIAVTGDDAVSEMDMRAVADWTVRRRLLAVPGVSQVVPIGGEVKQYQVLVARADAAYDVTLADVLHAAGRPTRTRRAASSWRRPGVPDPRHRAACRVSSDIAPPWSPYAAGRPC